MTELRDIIGVLHDAEQAGGTLAHGPDERGDFVLTASFP